MALRETMTEMLQLDEPRKRYAGMMSGLDVHYELGEGHPLLGRRMPDLDLASAGATQRVLAAARGAAGVVRSSARRTVPSTSLRGRIGCESTPQYKGAWELPVLGVVSAPTAALIRPDGYVAWVGEGTDPELPCALTTWFGGVSG